MNTLLHFDSVGSGVYRAIRQDILHLAMPPGARLQFEFLAKRFGVSHTPIREALQRLASEGLVEFLPRRGARVAPLSFDELEEIQAIRLGVETRLARLGAINTNVRSLGLAKAGLRTLKAALAGTDLDRYLGAYEVFRDICYERAGRPRLLRVAQDQRRRAERYLRFLCRDVGALRISGRHQVEFLKACEARDGKAAEAATRLALSWSLERLGDLLRKPEAKE